MKNQFVSLRIDNVLPQDNGNSTSILRKWKRLTTCQKRILLIVLFICLTSYTVGTQLHEIHKSNRLKKHPKNHNQLPPIDELLEPELGSDEIKSLYDIPIESPVDENSEESPGDDYEEEPPIDLEVSKNDAYDENVDLNEEFGENDKFDEINESDGIIAQKRLADTEKPPPEPVDDKYAWRGKGVENEKMAAVKGAFLHAWKGYKDYAFGHDMLKPISKRHEDWFSVGNDLIGLTLIDSLDVMVIMGLNEEFSVARDWIENKLSLAPNNNRVNLFECTIRVLGGFISTYYLTRDELFKEKAIDIGDRLMPAIVKSATNVPYSDINLRTKVAAVPAWGSSSSTSEVTTIQMEFGALSYLTGDSKYEDAVYRVSKHVSELQEGKLDGLVPLWIDPKTGKFARSGGTYTMGARTDSYYEYLFKRWYQDKDEKYEFMVNDFRDSMEGVRKHLFGYSQPNNYLLVGERNTSKRFSPKMDHLVCFLPGTLALAVHSAKLEKVWLEYAEKIAETCHQFYVTETGLAPEISYFNIDNANKPDLDIHTADRFSILRPETVESYFYLWRLTKNQKYRNWGWEFFQNLEKYAKVEHGYSSISNVQSKTDPKPRDKMESFFLGETLKYLYLLFSDDDLLPLENWVFNTEAHPFPVQK